MQRLPWGDFPVDDVWAPHYPPAWYVKQVSSQSATQLATQHAPSEHQHASGMPWFGETPTSPRGTEGPQHFNIYTPPGTPRNAPRDRDVCSGSRQISGAPLSVNGDLPHSVEFATAGVRDGGLPSSADADRCAEPEGPCEACQQVSAEKKFDMLILHFRTLPIAGVPENAFIQYAGICAKCAEEYQEAPRFTSVMPQYCTSCDKPLGIHFPERVGVLSTATLWERSHVKTTTELHLCERCYEKHFGIPGWPFRVRRAPPPPPRGPPLGPPHRRGPEITPEPSPRPLPSPPPGPPRGPPPGHPPGTWSWVGRTSQKTRCCLDCAAGGLTRCVCDIIR